MGYPRIKDFRRKRKLQINKIMGNKCILCGYDKCASALELHHINPEMKEFHISKILNRKWEDIESEIQKCILVCSNCHKEIHAGLHNDKLFKTSCNIDILNEVRESIKNTPIIYRCVDCGKEITKYANRCKECSHLHQLTIKYPEKDELIKMITENGFLKTGRLLGVTDNAVRKRCKKIGIPDKAKYYKRRLA